MPHGSLTCAPPSAPRHTASTRLSPDAPPPVGVAWAPAPAPPPYKTPSAGGPCRLSRLPPPPPPPSAPAQPRSAPAIPPPHPYLLVRPRPLGLTPDASRALSPPPKDTAGQTREESIAGDDR
ncbi:hypothetical protein PVAP13_5KG592314 [Panicum virgatum]|uniref:Uncharacterized protein n=1 Tax=Panicum virgatum TaxID=38727 RepID=A0A8T0SW13_PANVG|nr:hypothetical protein PVAP13_5KG592314 [Panicum virgatum]